MKKINYNICYILRNKIWPHKNSRLRHFYSIRSKFLMRRKFVNVFKNFYVKKKYGVVKRRKFFGRVNVTRKFVLANKSMKWVMGRRRFLPYLPLNIKKRANREHALSLQKKKYFRLFYNLKREKNLVDIYKKQWLKRRDFKEQAFFRHLESRIDIFVYRLRLLPTLYSTGQYISHFGVYVNNKLVKSTKFVLKIGDIVSLNKDHWNLFNCRLRHKLTVRSHGLKSLKNRRRFTLKKSLDFIKKLYKSRIFYFKAIVLQEYKKSRLIFFHIYKLFNITLTKLDGSEKEEFNSLYKSFLVTYLNFSKSYKALFSNIKIRDEIAVMSPRKKARNVAYILSKMNRNFGGANASNKRTFSSKKNGKSIFKAKNKKASYKYSKFRKIEIADSKHSKLNHKKGQILKLVKLVLLLYKINLFFLNLKYRLIERKEIPLSKISADLLVNKNSFFYLKNEKIEQLSSETQSYLYKREQLQKKLRSELYKKEKLRLLIDSKNLVLRVQNFSFDWVARIYNNNEGRSMKRRLKQLKRLNRHFYFKRLKKRGFWQEVVTRRRSFLGKNLEDSVQKDFSAKTSALEVNKFLRYSRFMSNRFASKVLLSFLKQSNLNKTKGDLTSKQLNINFATFKQLLKSFIKVEKKSLVYGKFKSSLKQKKTSFKLSQLITNRLRILNRYLILVENDSFLKKFIQGLQNNFIRIAQKKDSQSILIKKRSISSKDDIQKSIAARIFGNARELKRFKQLVKKQRLEKHRSRLRKVYKPHWYIPDYIEFDFKTLRGAMIYNPNQKEIVYPFTSNVMDVINFYKNKNL